MTSAMAVVSISKALADRTHLPAATLKISNAALQRLLLYNTPKNENFTLEL
jgi:hypothetical protein